MMFEIMKLLHYHKNEDFGTEHIFTVLKGKKRSFIQLEISWNDFKDFPYLQISFGNNSLIDVLFWVHKFGFALALFSYNWSRTEQ